MTHLQHHITHFWEHVHDLHVSFQDGHYSNPGMNSYIGILGDTDGPEVHSTIPG